MSLLRHVMVKPWQRKGVIGGLRPRGGAFDTEPSRVALVFFLLVATVLFSLFSVGYFIRMELPDWRPLAEPNQLWLNSGLLVLSSVLFQWARNLVRVDDDSAVGDAGAMATSESAIRHRLLFAFGAAGLLAFMFIGGQLLVWDSLQTAGYYMAANPANSFFYLFTGLHAAHLLGGLWVWSKSLIRLLSGTEVKDLRLSVELCALYWHFLLAVWLVLFAILANT